MSQTSPSRSALHRTPSEPSELADLRRRIDALERLSLEELREAWGVRYGALPALRSADLLRRLLAFRIQAEHQGRIDPELSRRLKRPEPKRAGPELEIGQRVAREWKGLRHEVEAVREGYRHQGRTYSSLSEVARAITGTRWNGPRFFGLRTASGVTNHGR